MMQLSADAKSSSRLSQKPPITVTRRILCEARGASSASMSGIGRRVLASRRAVSIYRRAVSEHPTIPLKFARRPEAEMRERATAWFMRMNQRRSVRSFSSDPVPLDIIRMAIRTAGTAPSGAHKQPWRFVMVTDPAIKHQIRLEAEAEERETYEHRMSDEWRAALAPLGTSPEKPYLDIVPVLIVMFRLDYEPARRRLAQQELLRARELRDRAGHADRRAA